GVGALAAAPARAADCVIPSAEVVSGVVLRAKPTTNSAHVGLLKPGQALAFVGTHTSWYEAQSGGTSVFASKRWTQVSTCPGGVTPPAPPPPPPAPGGGAPVPLLAKDHPVAWWFAFKFNSATFPGCGNGVQRPATCPFGGAAKTYPDGQQYAFASN